MQVTVHVDQSNVKLSMEVVRDMQNNIIKVIDMVEIYFTVVGYEDIGVLGVKLPWPCTQADAVAKITELVQVAKDRFVARHEDVLPVLCPDPSIEFPVTITNNG